MDIKKALSGRVVGAMPADVYALWNFVHVYMDSVGGENSVRLASPIWEAVVNLAYQLDVYVDAHTLLDADRLKRGYTEYTVYVANDEE